MRRVVAGFVGLVLIAGCNAEIGSDAAPPSSGGPMKVGEQLLEVVPESLKSVSPMSSSDALLQSAGVWYELTTDRAGTLWEFAARTEGEGHLHVRTTTLEGEVAEGVVKPPAISGVDKNARADQLSTPRASQRGPIVDLSWSAALCGSEGDGDCGLQETLSFGSEPDKAPERTRWRDDGRTGPGYSAQAKDRWLTVDYPYYIEQKTRSLDVVWRQSALRDARLWCIHSPLLLENGELVLLANDPVREGEAPEQLWRIGFDGDVEQRVHVMGRLTNGQLAHDTRNRISIVGAARGGDLEVLRLESGNSVRSWSFLRTQYSELAVLQVSVDLAGTLYVLTESGGREPEDRTPILCRVRETNEFDCVRLASLEPSTGARRMQATAPGVVYVRYGERLSRYELPDVER